MSPTPSPSTDDLVDVEYEAIESALLKTARGRAFLNAYSRRNRQADTERVLTASSGLKARSGRRIPMPKSSAFAAMFSRWHGYCDTRSQIASISGDTQGDTAIGKATGELGAIVRATESATESILASAEEIQEIAFTLREGGFAVETCDAIDERATNIYLACSFQDLTAQRTRKVIDAMQFLEDRISRMIDIWGFSREELQLPEATSNALHGPSEDGLAQADVDMTFGRLKARLRLRQIRRKPLTISPGWPCRKTGRRTARRRCPSRHRRQSKLRIMMNRRHFPIQHDHAGRNR